MYKTKIAAAFAAFVGLSTDGVAGKPAPMLVFPNETLRNSSGVGVVQKATFSDKMRMVFVVGLEGSGHHYVNGDVLGELCASGAVECPDVCSIADVWYNTLSKFGKASEYKDGLDQLRREMDALSLVANGLRKTTVAVATFQKCGGYHVGEMSFPNYGGQDKPLQYVDLKIFAEAAELAGIDLRLIYLSRPSTEILLSTTVHRNFGSFAHQARVLINAAAVISSSLGELHSDFWTCFEYENRSSSDQASRVAEFVMPTVDSASFFSQTLLDSSDSHGNHTEAEPTSWQEGWELVSNRLQDKLDEIERDFC